MSRLIPVTFPDVDAPPRKLEALLPPMEFSTERVGRDIGGGRIERLDGRELWQLCLKAQTSPDGQNLMRWAELTARVSQLAMEKGYPLSNVGPAVFRVYCEYVGIGEGSAEKMAKATVLKLLHDCWRHGEAFHSLYEATLETPGDRELVSRILNDALRP